MDRIRNLLSSVMAFALLSSSAFAADGAVTSSVKVRGSDKSDYSRIVFDWKNTPQYTTEQTDTRLIVKFSAAGNFVEEGNSLDSLSRVTGYKILSPQSVEIDFKAGQKIRHFIIDNRLVIDIKGEAGASEKIADKKPTEEKSVPKKEDAPVNLAAKIESASGAPAEEIKIEKPAGLDERIIIDEHTETPTVETATGAVAETEKSFPQYHVSVTSTAAISMAVFQRNGYLWVVEDKDDIKVPPQVEGKGEGADIGTFQRVPAIGSSAFRLKIPDGMSVVTSGGGLVWKIDIGNKTDASTKPTALKRLFGDDAKDGRPEMLWPAPSLKRITEIKDPDVGDSIYVAMVESAKEFSGGSQHYIDFEVLPSAAGFSAVSKIDDLEISKAPEGVLIGKPEGLSISSEKDVLNASKSVAPAPAKAEDNKEITRIFDFANWQMGTQKDLSDNQRLIMSGMAEQTEAKKAESLIGLGKLMLSFDYAPEAIGYLEVAQQMVPELDGNPEFLALRGAAGALSWKYKEAYNDFSAAGLNDIGEIPHWKAFTLAKLDDWQQAAKILPQDVSIIATYPDDVRNPFGLTLAEVALREGNIAKAKKILDILEPSRGLMSLPYASAFDYLKGEFLRQTGKKAEAKTIWKELSTGADDLYRAKSRFALTVLQLESKEITQDKAIDNLEGLRYAWRGDDLEVSINYNLAKTYLDKGEPVKALTMMKLAHSLNPVSEQGKKINADMHALFKSLFTTEKIKTLSPVDALTVYNEFSNLAPSGAEGEALTRQLAERLADADLLPRATVLLKKQVDGDLQGLEGSTVAIRLAALQNMDGKPDDALQSLDKAEVFLKGLPAEEVLPKQRDIGLLRAKAYSLKGKPDDAFAALALVAQDDDSLRLRADIGWRGKKWQDAADSLEQLVQNQEISLTRPLTDEQTDLILNWAVALYLADNRYVLANVRERYSDAMAATPKAQKFEVVTRPRQAALLADRETINSIIDETVIFKDFLKSFKAGDTVPEKKGESVPVTSAPSAQGTSVVPPEALRNVPGLKADEVLGD